MKLKLVLSSLFLILTFSSLSAQILELGGRIGNVGIDTVMVDSNIQANLFVRNLDSIPYTGDIVMYAHINGDSANAFVFDSITVVSLNQGDSVNFVSNFMASLTTFSGGVNIVVAWPAALGAGFVELTDTVYVDTISTTGLSGPLKARGIKIFPNPTRASFSIAYGILAPLPMGLSIVDAAGKEVYTTDSEFGTVDLSLFRSGVYFIRMDFYNGQKYHAKVIKY